MNFSRDDIRSLILGIDVARKCPCCDSDGQEWWDGDTGLGVGPNPPKGIDVDSVCHGDCENCKGLGFLIGEKL